MGFDEAINRIRRQAEGCELNILIWGPGKNSGAHYEKRLKFKNEIAGCFPNADVRFSEEIDLTAALPGIDGLDYPSQELWHLAACDLCVVLDTSKGAGEEVALFSQSRYAYKLLILTHERHKLSTDFPAALRRYQNQIFYNDRQYDTCDLVEQVLTRIKIAALGKIGGFRV